MFAPALKADRDSAAGWCAIFDWDGVIVDSSRLHEESWEIMAAREHRKLPPGHFKRGFGMKNERIIPEVLGWTDDPKEVRRLADAKEGTYRELVRRDGLSPLPGVVPWLRELRKAGIPCAVGSSTCRANIDCVLETANLRGYFAAVVSGDDARHGKPDPEIFLLAADRLGAARERCVVFEDAHVGIEAARAAGMAVVAVTTTHSAADLDDADAVVQKLDELKVDQVARLAVSRSTGRRA